MAIDAVPFFFQENFPNLTCKAISTKTRQFLDSEPQLKGKYKIEVKKNVTYIFYAKQPEPAVDIRLYVAVGQKIAAFFKALQALFKGRNQNFELRPNREMLATFFAFKEAQGIADLKAAYQQGRTVHIYVGLNPQNRRLHCRVKGRETIQNVYKGCMKMYVAVHPNETDRRIYRILNRFLLIRELNFAYRQAYLRTTELSGPDSLQPWEGALVAFGQSMVRVSRSLEISSESYTVLLREWQKSHPDRTEQEIDQTVDILAQDNTVENMVTVVSRDSYLYPVWCRLVEKIILSDLHALFNSIKKYQELAGRLTVLPETAEQWTQLVQKVEDACKFNTNLKGVQEIVEKWRFFLNTTKDILPGKRGTM